MTPAPADPEPVILGLGDVWVGAGAPRVSTVLGSCVSVTAWHPELRIAGMCHYVLPQRTRGRSADTATPGWYADEAVDVLLTRLTRWSPADRYVLRLFGGAHQQGAPPDWADSVGHANVVRGLDLLTRHGLRVTSRDVGGIHARRIALTLDTGEVTVDLPHLTGAHG